MLYIYQFTGNIMLHWNVSPNIVFLVFIAKSSNIQFFPIKWFNGEVRGMSFTVDRTINLETVSSWSDVVGRQEIDSL